MLGIKIKLCNPKYFIQFNPEAKNSLNPLYLEETPSKVGLLLFKYLILSYRDTEANFFFVLFFGSSFPASHYG